MGVNSLPKPVTRQCRDCDLNPGRSAPESSTLTTRLASRALCVHAGLKPVSGVAQVTIRRKKSSIFVISRPDVYVSSSADTYVIFGEARVRGFSFVFTARRSRNTLRSAVSVHYKPAFCRNDLSDRYDFR